MIYQGDLQKILNVYRFPSVEATNIANFYANGARAKISEAVSPIIGVKKVHKCLSFVIFPCVNISLIILFLFIWFFLYRGKTKYFAYSFRGHCVHQLQQLKEEFRHS
jgi:hypothetical protein